MQRTRIGALALLLTMAITPAAHAAGVTFVDAIRDSLRLTDANAVTVSPDGANVYAVAQSANTLVAFARASDTGALTRIDVETDGVDGVEGLDGPFAMAMSPDGAHVYVASTGDNAVAVFARDPGSGTLEFVEAVQVLDPEGITVSPEGAHVYVASFSSGTITVYARDPATGALELNDFVTDGIAGVDGLDGVAGLAVSRDGRNLYAVSFRDSGIVTFARDAVSGTLRFVEAKKGAAGVLGGVSVTVSADGAHVYAAGISGNEVVAFARDPATGALTRIDTERDGVAGVDGLQFARSVALSPDGTLPSAAGQGDDALAVFARDPATGTLSFLEAEIDGVNGVEALGAASAVAPSPDGANVYVTAEGPDSLVTFAVDGVAVTTTTTTTSTTTTTVAGCGPEPLAGCRSATGGKTGLLIKDLSNDGKDQIVVKWDRVPATAVADFGDPLTTTDYTFCLYDREGALLLSAAAPAGRLCDGKPCWSAIRDGFRYRDRQKGLDGLTQVQLDADRNGDAKLTVTGKGPNLSLPALPLPDGQLVSQLVARDGLCVDALLQAVRNDSTVVEAVIN